MGRHIGLIYFEYETFASSRINAISWCLSFDVSLYCGWTMILSTPISTTGSAHFKIWPVAVLDGMQSCSVSILYSPRRTPFLCPFKMLQYNVEKNCFCFYPISRCKMLCFANNLSPKQYLLIYMHSNLSLKYFLLNVIHLIGYSIRTYKPDLLSYNCPVTQCAAVST